MRLSVRAERRSEASPSTQDTVHDVPLEWGDCDHGGTVSAASVRGPRQSPVLPFACGAGSLRSNGRVRGAQSLAHRGGARRRHRAHSLICGALNSPAFLLAGINPAARVALPSISLFLFLLGSPQ